MGNDYFTHMTAMDRAYYQQLDSFGSIYHPAALHEHDGGMKTALGPRDLGMSNNPFQHQLVALQAKIREGASSIEFQFPGRGKSSSQSSTPEAYGYEEREALRTLAEYNDVKTSTHATFSISGLAGWNQNQGFSKQAQHQNMEEVRRAVDFASQASTGGAVVVHTGEWARPISEADWAKKDFGTIKRTDENGNPIELPAFIGYPDEQKESQVIVVDSSTGQLQGGLRKDLGITRPQWVHAGEYEKITGRKLAGVDFKGNATTYKDDDIVDMDGRKLNPLDTEELFYRMPKFDKENSKFETENVTWQQLVDDTKKFNKEHGTNYTPEVMQARIQIDNQILQARGSSLFHAQRYEDQLEKRRKLQKALEYVEKLDKNLPEEEKWRLAAKEPGFGGAIDQFVPSESKPIKQILKEQIDDYERSLRHTQEASSSADVQAADLISRQKNLMSVEEYGLQQSGRALGELGIYALEKSKAMIENIKQKGGDTSKYEKLYIAPENVFPHEYGSHPDELIKIVEKGREEMVKRLVNQFGKDPEEARKVAAEHIKSTIDIGHLNMWKTHMVRKPGETEDQLNKRFEKWTMEKLETMHKKGVLGHFHLTDNLGFNDEHLTPGQGNAPIKAFVQKLESLGYKDFIIEPGSFNAGTILGESWSYLGASTFKPMGPGTSFGPRFSETHWRHAGGYAPPNYVVGSYVPSNEWTFWSGTPLE
jgi:hypothetical protein